MSPLRVLWLTTTSVVSASSSHLCHHTHCHVLQLSLRLSVSFNLHFKGKDDNDLVIFVAVANSHVPETWYTATDVCWMNDYHRNKFFFRRYYSSNLSILLGHPFLSTDGFYLHYQTLIFLVSAKKMIYLCMQTPASRMFYYKDITSTNSPS